MLHYVETSSMIYNTNQWGGFNVIATMDGNELRNSCFRPQRDQSVDKANQRTANLMSCVKHDSGVRMKW